MGCSPLPPCPHAPLPCFPTGEEHTTMPEYTFDVKNFFPLKILNAITEVRVEEPRVILEEAAGRRKRGALTRDGKLTILATDHPGRGVIGVAGHPTRMGDRQEYLGRVLRVITGPEFDGVMGPPDLIEDLMIVNHLVRRGGGPAFLDDKVIVGCMQRGGVAGVVGEIDDRFGAYTAESIAETRLDGGKMMFRCVTDDERTLSTIDYCARAITELNRRDLVPFVEPMPIKFEDGKYTSDYTIPNLIKYISVAAALGDSSRRMWLKVPYCPGYEEVARATTLPILMLGGESKGDAGPILRNFATGMKAGANVRGTLVGRNVLFPGEEDPLTVALAVNEIVHSGSSAAEAMEGMEGHRDLNLDCLTKYVS